MSKHFATCVLTAALCLILVGCGSDGPNLRPELDRLTDLVEQQTDLVEQQTEKLGELETDLETQREEAADREETLQGQIDEAEQETEAERQRREAAEQQAEQARQQAEQARQQAEQARQQAEQARQQAQEEIRRQAQALEANQRAENLLNALEGLSDPTALTGFTAPPEAGVSVATRNTLTFGPPTSRKSSSTRSGFRYAKVADTFGRIRTTAIYTDRELSRRLLDHYGAHLQGTTQIQLDASNANLVVAATDFFVTNSPVTLDNYGGVPRTEPDTAYSTPAGLTSLRGKLHGQSGTFRCTNANCSITLTPAYNDDHDSNADTPNRLSGLTTSGIEVFEPGGASIALCEDSSACPFNDTEYMVFGYWIEDPESATGTYAVLPFAQVFQGSAVAAVPSSGTARYTGSAVGVYVESPPFGSTDTDKRQGDFEASVSLTATFGGNVGGWISGFNTTPRGGSAAPRTSNWRVTLADVTAAGTVTGSATIDGLGGSGNWAAQFVQARSDEASDEPPAIVGVFDTSGPSLHLVGAFGAEH